MVSDPTWYSMRAQALAPQPRGYTPSGSSESRKPSHASWPMDWKSPYRKTFQSCSVRPNLFDVVDDYSPAQALSHRSTARGSNANQIIAKCFNLQQIKPKSSNISSTIFKSTNIKSYMALNIQYSNHTRQSDSSNWDNESYKSHKARSMCKTTAASIRVSLCFETEMLSDRIPALRRDDGDGNIDSLVRVHRVWVCSAKLWIFSFEYSYEECVPSRLQR